MTEETKARQSRPRRLLRAKAAGDYLGISAWSIRQLVVNGKLPYVQPLEGGPFLIDIRDLDGLIEREKTVRT
jgi:excisionase family DNA binding protein